MIRQQAPIFGACFDQAKSNFNTLPMSPNNFSQNAERMQNQIDGSLKNLFKNDIRGSFLIDIKYRGLNELVENFFTLYDFSYPEGQIITGVGAYHEYDICKHIVGIHKANTIFFTAE